MPDTFMNRARKAWSAFMNRDPTATLGRGEATYIRGDKPYRRVCNERSVVNAVQNRIAMDVASIDILHARLDEEGRYASDIEDGLNTCLTSEANLDQTSRAFIQDAVLTMLEEGVVAMLPTYTSRDPNLTESYDIYEMRVCKIVTWYPDSVKVNAYNDRTGKREDVIVRKQNIAIVENPFHTVMNSPNSTMQRLIRKLSLLDMVDEHNSSGKLDLIIQLPYAVKTDLQRDRANTRQHDLETQLASSKYGIGYIDSTEHITQLNRSVENNLFNQVEYLTNLMYSQLGMTVEIMNGTAKEEVMVNYFNRIIEPIVSAIADEMKRKFLSKTARSQGQSIVFFRDAFKLVPAEKLADLADKFTRNEIMTSNEFRQIIGRKPSNDPNADVLRNKNISQPTPDMMPEEGTTVDANGNVINEEEEME